MSQIQRYKEIPTGLLKAGRGGKGELEAYEDTNHCSVSQDERFLEMDGGAANTV